MSHTPRRAGQDFNEAEFTAQKVIELREKYPNKSDRQIQTMAKKEC